MSFLSFAVINIAITFLIYVSYPPAIVDDNFQIDFIGIIPQRSLNTLILGVGVPAIDIKIRSLLSSFIWQKH